MDFASYTGFDWGVLIIILLSVIHAFTRGFTSVALSLAAWAGALTVTIFGFVPLSPFVRDVIQPEQLADLLLVVGLFIVSLILLKIAADNVGSAVRSSAIGFLDRSLGALFGLLRGLVIVSVVFIGLKAILGKDQPPWITNAKTKPLVEWGATMVEELTGSALGQADKSPLDVIEESFTSGTQAASDLLEEAVAEQVAKEAAKYKDQAREKLNKTIEQKLKEAEKKKQDDPKKP